MVESCPCCSVMVVKNLNRWFKEKWVDVSRKDKDGKHPPCGRSKAKKGSKGYPKCRPSVKVSSKTPKTSGSMSEGQKRAATKRKRSKKQGVGGKPTIVKQVVVLKRDLSEMTDYEIDRARSANDNPELQSEERTRAMDRMAEYARMNHPPAYALEEMFGEQVADAHDEVGDYDHADYFGDSIDPNEMHQYILENAGEEAAQNYINMYRMYRSQYGGNHASMSQLDAQGMKDNNDVIDFATNRENLTQDLETMMPTDSSVFDAFPYPEGTEFINHLSPPFTSTPENESNFQMKYAGESMDLAMRLLKTRIASPDEDHPQIGTTVYNPETNQVLDSSLRIMPIKHGRHNQPENVIRDLIHEDMHVATLPELGKPKLYGQVMNPKMAHAEFPAFFGEEVYSQRLAEEGKSERRREPYDLERTTPFNQALYRVSTHPNVPAEERGQAKQAWFNSIQTGEPMDITFQLLKNPVSPEAKRHKLEYDTKYESTPERVKYREELKRERRHRGIDGKGGPDMSHTKDHTLVAEDPHTNRARHFKERGTLKGDPMDIAWILVKGER